MAGADLLWEKSTAGWLLVAGLLWEKSTAGRTGRYWKPDSDKHHLCIRIQNWPWSCSSIQLLGSVEALFRLCSCLKYWWLNSQHPPNTPTLFFPTYIIMLLKYQMRFRQKKVSNEQTATQQTCQFWAPDEARDSRHNGLRKVPGLLQLSVIGAPRVW
jgi:hypothetical protein